MTKLGEIDVRKIEENAIIELTSLLTGDEEGRKLVKNDDKKWRI